MSLGEGRVEKLRGLALVALLLWAGLWLALEVKARAGLYGEPVPPRRASRWQLGTEPVARLEAFLTAATAEIPPGSRVAFLPARRQRDEFFTVLWAAYLLPRHHVIPGGTKIAEREAEYWIAYGRPLRRPNLEPIHRSPQGAALRVVAAP